MTREELDFIGSMNMCDEISDEAYKKIVCHCDGQEPCEDAISRREAIKMFTYNYEGERIPDYDCDNFPVQIAMKTVKEILRELPSVNPQYTVNEIQKIQDLEQAELEKAYELGRAEGQKARDKA